MYGWLFVLSLNICPGDIAPVVLNTRGGLREITMAKWGMPSTKRSLFEAAAKSAERCDALGKRKARKFNHILKTSIDKRTAIIGDVRSLHWRRWLNVENRCLVPFNSFAEFDQRSRGSVWFALSSSWPLAFFAGICTKQNNESGGRGRIYQKFGVLSMKPIDTNGNRQRKPMPVVLTTQEEVKVWMTAPIDEALTLRASSHSEKLKILAPHKKQSESSIDC